MGATQSTTSSCELKTPRGSLKGLQLSDRAGKPIYQRYTHIPYAKPPLGPLRWRRPQPLAKNWTFSDPDYTNFGPVCPQPVYGNGAAAVANPNAAPPVINTQNEDCLYLNIWVPCTSPPAGGFPIQFYIHGGWLQVGHAMQSNEYDPFDLLRLTEYPRIIVTPTYRLNLLGFLTGPVLEQLAEDDEPGNYGFWDQRLALEWTAANIKYFGGNPDQIAVGGLSAGANSTVFQLYYDTYLPPEQRLIKRIYLNSNSVGIQPNSTTSQASIDQFNGLCAALNIPPSLPPAELIGRLRSIPAEKLISTIPKLALHTFRATTEESFIPSTFLQSIHDGSFTTRLARNNISIVLGEVAHESRLYRLVNPPSTHEALTTQLTNYYPGPVVRALLKHYPVPAAGDAEAISALYAHICATCQVHATIRGFTRSLLHPPPHSAEGSRNIPLPKERLHRYRLSWRAACMDAWVRPDMGVTHGMCQPLWWMSGVRCGWTARDVRTALRFVEPFGKWLYGDESGFADGDGDGEGVGVGGGGEGEGHEIESRGGVNVGGRKGALDAERRVRHLDESGRLGVVADDEERWEEGLAVWDVMWRAQQGGLDARKIVEKARL